MFASAVTLKDAPEAWHPDQPPSQSHRHAVHLLTSAAAQMDSCTHRHTDWHSEATAHLGLMPHS